VNCFRFILELLLEIAMIAGETASNPITIIATPIEFPLAVRIERG